MFKKIDKQLLNEISGFHSIPQGAYSIRKNGEGVSLKSTEDITIVKKENKQGLDIFVKSNTKNKSLHMPVIITEGGVEDLVYNDFYIGENAEVLIVAGCGIHNSTNKDSQHNGIHSFHLEKNSKVKYFEKHLALGDGNGDKNLNPTTKIIMKDNAIFEMETIQLGGVSTSDRKTNAVLFKDAKLLVKEKILTSENQVAKTNFEVVLKQKGSSAKLQSRSVAKGKSKQMFASKIQGLDECFGHVECDGILLDEAIIESTPKIVAKNINASLVHEAAIGKIAGEQIIKLQTLGLSEEEAEAEIIKGFLK